jgi:hypothetical protein
MSTTTTYTTHGSVRGGCGHTHRTLDATERCRQRDADECASLGGGAYSDRQVVHSDMSALTLEEVNCLAVMVYDDAL